MLSRVSYAVKVCDEAMAQYDFPTATTACYNLWLYDLCDVYLVCILRIKCSHKVSYYIVVN